jgi:hypothetical protein
LPDEPICMIPEEPPLIYPSLFCYMLPPAPVIEFY